MFQSSIIGHTLCSIILDGLQDFIQDNLPVKYKKPEKKLEIKYKRGNKLIYSASYASLKVFCVRYADEVLILGKCLKLHAKRIQSLFVEFLDQRGLKIKNGSTFHSKRLKPDFSINYLGFTFKYPNISSGLFSKKKFTKAKFNPISTSDKILSRYFQAESYLLFFNSFFKKLKITLKVQLSRRNNYLTVEKMIDEINTTLITALNCCDSIWIAKKQLLPINNLLHKLFYKYLLRKFSSVPKTYEFIKMNFMHQNRFKSGSKILLRLSCMDLLDPSVLFFCLNCNLFVV